MPIAHFVAPRCPGLVRHPLKRERPGALLQTRETSSSWLTPSIRNQVPVFSAALTWAISEARIVAAGDARCRDPVAGTLFLAFYREYPVDKQRDDSASGGRGDRCA